MNLHRGRIQAERLNPNAHDLLALQFFKGPVQRTALRLAIHPCVDRMPVAKTLRQPSPLTAMLGYIQHCIQKLQVRQDYIAPLNRQTILDSRVLLFRDLHLLPLYRSLMEIVLTRPNRPQL